MQYSFVKSLLESIWMIHPDAASAYYPLLRGALSGMEFMKEPEPEDNKPFLMSLSHSNKIIVTDEPGRMNYGDENDQFIFVTPLKGTVLKHDAECGPRGTRTLASRMSTWDKNKQVIGHIIVTESGGGQAAGVPEMADAISNLTKPVVAWIDGMSASAAYYINSYCSHIMASRATDQIGCIGTLIQLHGFPKFAKLDDGSVVARIYADGADEKNEEFEKALEGNFTLIKERLLNPHNEQFKADVRSNRTAVLDEQLKGRTYNASDVVGTLIDSIGSFEDAIQKVIELSNSTKNNSKSNNSKKMEQLTNLNNIESVRDFEVTEGQASFNEQQLQDIESALAAGTQAASQVVTLTSENNTLRNDVTARDNRIAELEAALAGDGAHAAVESAAVNTDGILNPKPVDEFQSAKEFCENHLKSVK
ncbi:MAG: S49 family peptidase [Bacteroidales bacterium]|nr:S49 family peptidase [Bacteroidales bacterium]